MHIETNSAKVREARTYALELLLSEHVGDCEAPCRVICPASMNIPLMIRQIMGGQLSEALLTVKEHIPLPAVLGRICSAPCEKGCRRRKFDDPVGICLLKRHVADIDLASASPYVPACRAASGKKVAIAGSGPTGLSAAYFLRRNGHECTVFDKMPEPGGALRYEAPEETLPRSVLDDEIEIIRKLGVRFEMNTPICESFSLTDLTAKFDAVVIATGRMELQNENWCAGVATGARGVEVEKGVFATNLAGVYAGGDAVIPLRMAVRSVGNGRSIATAIDCFLANGGRPPAKRFNSRMGKLAHNDMDEFLKGAALSPHLIAGAADDGGYSVQEAVAEAARCLHCDCRDVESCKLRLYADEYGAKQATFKGEERGAFRRICEHEDIIYEPGKCIKCGLCVRITAEEGEALGLAFQGRGFSTQVGVPFGDSLADALTKSAARCAEACPTGALALLGTK